MSRPDDRHHVLPMLTGLNRARFLVLLALLMGVPAVAFGANIQGPRRSALEKLKEGDAVRKRYMLRLNRFEVAPAVGFTLNDAFRRTMLSGISLGYHITDNVAINAVGLFGFQFDTDLADQLERKRPDRVAEGDFADVKLLGSFELTYTPLFGKVAIFQKFVLDYDFHTIIGGGVAQVAGDEELDKFSPTAVVGVGFRFFIMRWMALNVQVRDYIYSSALNSVVDQDAEGEAEARADTEFKNNFVISISYSFLFPRIPSIGD
ncbi:MAG: outer membrane beta-barrel domain-containing protein [Myxococcota bacterium]|nr:outer membrane beta-barrel domain-containing protein [Myxococcota bacterium]